MFLAIKHSNDVTSFSVFSMHLAVVVYFTLAHCIMLFEHFIGDQRFNTAFFAHTFSETGRMTKKEMILFALRFEYVRKKIKI